VLNAFCAGQHGATCDFTPTSTEERMTDWEKSGIPEYNDTSSPITKKFTVEHTVLAKENYEVSASMKATVAKVFEASIAAKYGRETSRSEKFTNETTLTIKPGMKLTPLGRYPIVRDTGDFTIKVGSSTWKVTGVIVDTPDVNRFADIKWSESPIDSAADLQGAQSILDAPPVIDTGTS
jgi:hypothetical protein